MDLSSFSYPDTWLACIEANDKRFTAVQTGIIKINWNTIHQHMTEQKLDRKRFSTQDALRDLARTLTH
eukprot:6199738-Pleurochrysis_carterae.AAC.1